MACASFENSKGEKPRKRRRSKWAADLEHLIPGGKEMSDEELEAKLYWLLMDRN